MKRAIQSLLIKDGLSQHDVFLQNNVFMDSSEITSLLRIPLYSKKPEDKIMKMRMQCRLPFFTAMILGVILMAFTPAHTGVSLKTMKNNMLDDLDGTVNGYAFVIKKGSTTRTGADGWARRPVDGGTAMTVNTRSFIASVTKTITAVATLQLLEANDLTVTHKIAPWLPNDWVKGPGIGQLTFKDLMQHKTGFKEIFNSLSHEEKQNWGNDWDGLKWIVENGAIPGSSSSYKNANFALLRVIIPKLWKASGADDADFVELTSGNNGLLYVLYVTNHIFEPSGIAPGASCTASEGFKPQAMGYDVADPDEAGIMSETSWPNCGGHAGLRLSARDLVRFMYHLDQGDLLSPQARFAMDVFRLGWNQNSNTNSNGRKNKWWHGGSWNQSSNRGYRACVMKFPQDDVVASLVINSRTEGKGACGILKDAYDNAL